MYIDKLYILYKDKKVNAITDSMDIFKSYLNQIKQIMIEEKIEMNLDIKEITERRYIDKISISNRDNNLIEYHNIFIPQYVEYILLDDINLTEVSYYYSELRMSLMESHEKIVKKNGKKRMYSKMLKDKLDMLDKDYSILLSRLGFTYWKNIFLK